MPEIPSPSGSETSLQSLLGRFDSDDKLRLAQTLVDQFGLDEDEPFAPQLRHLLKRDLRPAERFRLDILYRAYAFHNEEDEEEEEEE
mgnify:CR=1 FL=1|jgi:hypothetical protein